MSQTLNITNYGPNNLLQETRLNAQLPANSAAIGVVNNQGFATGDFIIVGTLGEDTAELLTVQSVTGANTVTPTAATVLEHPAYEYVNKLFGNKIKVYRAANSSGLQPADSDFTLLATIDIQPDRAYTQYTDSGGDITYWYKFTYYNSTTAAETNKSDSAAKRGGSSGDYCSIWDVRLEAGFRYAPYVTDDMIDAKRQAAQEEINGALAGFYSVPFQPPINARISDICTRLAAGLLLNEQYSQITSQTTASGDAKLQGARADLNSLATKQSELIDSTGASMAQSGSTGAIEGYPNSSTATAPASQGGARRVFRMSDIQGRGGRHNPSYGRKW